ncbi:MAG: hypothetical protein ACFHXK_11600 [bacterium]
MTKIPEQSVDGYQWKKFTAHDTPKLLGWMVGSGSGAVIEADEETPDLAKEGFDEGYAKGFAAGEAEALAQQQATLDQLNLIVQECRSFLHNQQDESLADAATVLAGLFQALFNHELQTSEHMLQMMIEQTRKMFDGTPELLVHLNTSDYSSISRCISAELEEILIADEDVPQGVVRASAGQSIVELDVVKNMQALLRSADLNGLAHQPSADDEGYLE